jgi:hypothetical protein
MGAEYRGDQDALTPSDVDEGADRREVPGLEQSADTLCLGGSATPDGNDQASDGMPLVAGPRLADHSSDEAGVRVPG